MNFLQLAQRVATEAGIPHTGLVTTINQTGELGRVVAWTADAWLTIQRLRKWNWLWEQASVTIAAGSNVTPGSIPGNRYLKDKTFFGTARLLYRPWDEFSSLYRTISTTQPTEWTIRPDNAFVVNAAPLAETVLSVERYQRPTALALDDDTPVMPSEFHMAIVWRALMDAADYDEAGVTRATAGAKFAEVLGDELAEDTPDFQLGDALL